MHADPLMHAEALEHQQAVREAELAHEIEAAAEQFRRGIEARDIYSDAVDVDEDDQLLGLIKAGRFDEAGQEWARRIADWCVRCAEIQVGVQPTVREAELAPLMGRADWSPSLGHARFMPLGGG